MDPWWIKLKGKRTYFVCTLMALVACVGMMSGQMAGENACSLILEGIAIFFLRAGIDGKS